MTSNLIIELSGQKAGEWGWKAAYRMCKVSEI